ncbi:MAG: hypothetical protein GY814_01515 [Gammaproteobacteria bacterium]|nr:hypothetical protein [Gammaproteobacteria bacterium]
MNNLATFLRTKGISIVWISAVFSPVLLVMGTIEDKQLHLVLGLILMLLVLWSIMDGIKALRNRMVSNFIGSVFIPIVSIAFGTVFAIMKYANPS